MKKERPKQHSNLPERLLVWGTYDLGKPRVRILLRGLRENSVEILECHADVWSDIEDKSQISGSKQKLLRLIRWMSNYPMLVYRFLRAPKHDTVLVPYMGHLDVIVLWPFAKLYGTRIIWDAFISIYNTIVEDRNLISKNNPIAWAIYGVEWLATRAADHVVLDTKAHANYFTERYRLPKGKLASVFVGAEQNQFPVLAPLKEKEPGKPLTVLFYGQFIPLHGIPTIVRAAQKVDDGSIQWILIGTGQEEETVRAMLEKEPVSHLTWIPWVSYEKLTQWIEKSDVCLGIFGNSEKASRVIPNKVFQIISAGRPIITRDSSAIRELFGPSERGVYLVPPNDALAVVRALEMFSADRDDLSNKSLYRNLRSRITTIGVGSDFRAKLMDGFP